MVRSSLPAAIAAFCLLLPARGERVMEKLGRGLVAVRQADGGVFLSWRSLASDPRGLRFHVYRVTSGREQRITREPLDGATQYVDHESAEAESYLVRLVTREGGEGEPSRRAKVLAQPFVEIPIQAIPDYRPGDCSAADLDGDGEYEIVVHQVSRGRDNSFTGMTGTPVLDAYKLDGTHLWRIDLGINIREGEHYTQFMVYDLDGDGRAELACKTADGTKDGTGTTIGDATKDWRNKEERSQKFGRILSGPEYLTVFDGRTGAALKTAEFIPGRDPIDGWGGIGGNGGNDSYGNRCDRFLACVAYLDGVRPSLVMSRGVYGRTVLAAWDWRGGELKSRWVFDSGVAKPPFEKVSPYSGMGGHALSVADVDGDGKDEIVYQAMTVDDDGKGLYSTGRRHGDALHVGDFDPSREGLELYLVTENEERTVSLQTPGAGLHDARTGKPLWSHSPGMDISDGVVADIDPRHPGAEVWGGSGGLRTIKGIEIGPRPRHSDWVVWWDGDLLREIYGGFAVHKWNPVEGKEQKIFDASPGSGRGNRYMGMRPNLAADLLGDWREELLLPGPDGKSLRLHISTMPTKHRLVTLMQDPQYRLSIAWQNVSYNKPPHPSFFLGEGMTLRDTPHSLQRTRE
ncbi:rhamnogalacturonan lyase [Luteolibacter sp. GHJ8]|uniref:Rhamnogalacturonan lyase n=1 Tax=Luteolibacter rhizosphaerae TaxID=2989719 RepID=A0ABT3G0J0_9BACT|nr:rhamnogalacturonan lyase [Luteolibacter rhizosphaerae]MCW1913356.1 rhamnogalacturonan lyase [Luteolibacter rhizosphaerae]